MAPERDRVASSDVANGSAALREGRWEAAREFFVASITGGATAEGYEGLSWAAWWLDDADTVVAARERAYGLYRRSGDPAGAARMATWLAADQLDFRGAWAVASGWLRRAHRLVDGLDDEPVHGWLAFHEGYIAHRLGDTARALELARYAAHIGRRFGVPDLEMLGLALEGSVLVACAEVSDGMRCLDEATAAALEGEATIPISGAWACCFLVSACLSVYDYERAFQWCERIREFAERYGSRYMLSFCRSEYGAIDLWRGQWQRAEALLQASIDDYTASRPVMVVMPLVVLGELRRRQGRPDDAERLLDQAGSSSAVDLCRARLGLDRGEPRVAIEVGERLLRQIPEHRRMDRGPVLELLARAFIAAGELDQARSAVDALRGVATLVGTEPLRALADLIAGMLAAAHGEHVRARPLLEDAVTCFDRSGAPFEVAVARLELAKSLLPLGCLDAARAEASMGLQCFLDLAAELEAKRARRIHDAIQAAAGASVPGPVTKREREVLQLLAEGRTNRQIAETLVVSVHTVHRHVTNILRKLDLSSRAAAAAYAVQSGLTDARRD